MESRREIAIAETEPGLVSEEAEGVDHVEAVARQAVAAFGMDATREGVGDDVEIRRDVNAVEGMVVAGVDDGDHVGGRHYLDRARRKRAAPTPPASATTGPGIGVPLCRARCSRSFREIRLQAGKALGDLAGSRTFGDARTIRCAGSLKMFWIAA